MLYEYSKKSIIKNNAILPINDSSKNQGQEIKNFYKYIIDLNENINKNFRFSKFNYEVNISILKKINYDIMLFIPNGCYKFLNLFVDEENYKKVMFWEFHIDGTKPNTHKIFPKSFKNKRVLLIDSVYSGKTLLKLKKIIEEEGGTVILFGLYPKSKSVLNILDYTLILNKIYNVKKLKIDDYIFEKIYIEALRGDKYGKRKANKI